MSVSTFYKRQCIYLPAMAGWFVCSAALTSYNKLIFGQSHGAFPCPLFLTSIHFFVQWTFSYGVSALFPDFFGGRVVKNMPWKTYLGISIPCGFVTAADIALSNLSLVRISVTFFTMVKSSGPVWTLLSGFIFGLFPITCNLLMVGFLITAGEILTAFGEVEFDTKGFLLCLGAATCGGIRWTLVQYKLQKLDPPLGGPIVTMRVLASTMFFTMLALSSIIERPWNALDPKNGSYFSDFENGMQTISLGLIGAFIAIAMVLCEFWLILKADAIVLMIGGVLKEMITIFVGVTLFGDNLNAVNVSGIVVVFLGIFLYKVTLHISKKKTQKKNLVNKPGTDAHFSRINGNDAYDDEPKKNSESDLALNFDMDDIDDDETDIDGSSPLHRKRSQFFELEHGGERTLGAIT